MADIFISTDFSSLVEADKALNKLGKDTTAYIRTLKTMAMADIGLAKEQRVLNEAINNMSPALDRVNRQMRQKQKAISQYSDSINKSTKSLNRFGFVSQQVGYQVGDFFVQIQSGTNPLVAFGQQATQLAGLLTLSLNPAIAAWGVGLSVAIPLITALGATWMRSSQESNESVNKIKSNLDDLKSTIDSLHLDNIKIGFKTDEGSVAKVKEDLLKLSIDILEAQKPKAASGGFTGYKVAASDQQEVVDALQAEIEIRKKLLDQYEAEKEAQRMLNGGLSVAANMQAAAIRDKQEQLRVQKELEEQTKRTYEYYGKTRQEAQNLVTAVNEALKNENASDFQKAMKDALDAGITFSNLNLASPVIKAMNAAGSLFGYMMAATHPANIPFIPSSGLGLPSGRSDLAPETSKRPPVRNEAAWNEYFGPAAGKGSGGGSVQSAIESFKKQLQLERELIGTSEAYKEVRQALGDEFKTTDPLVIANLVAQQEETKKLLDLDQQRQDLIKSAESALESGFMSMVDGTKSVKEAFRSMASDIIRELYRVLVVQRLVGVVSDAVSGGLSGSPISLGTAAPKPTSSAKLSIGRSTQSMSSNTPVIVNNNINVTGTGDAAYVRGEVAKMMPQITSITKTAVIEARRRGGQMKQAFI